MNKYLKEGIYITTQLDKSDISFYYALGGSVLSVDKPNDIDIICCHTTLTKSGKISWVANKLKDYGYEPIPNTLQNGLHNINQKFYNKTKDITIHIIVERFNNG